MLVQKVSTSHEAPVLRSTMPGGDAEAMATLVMAYGYAVCSIYDIRHYETVRISGTIMQTVPADHLTRLESYQEMRTGP